MYLHGQGVEPDLGKAFQCFEEAALVGSPIGLFNLGILYNEGIGTSYSCETALVMFDAVMRTSGITDYLTRAYTLYTNKNYLGAFLAYSVSAQLNNENAQLSLAYMWEKGLVPLQCIHEEWACTGLMYHQAAARHESEHAYSKLADIYFYYIEDYETAYEYYGKATMYPQALFSQAYMDQHGLGVPMNITTAKRKYTQIVELATADLIEREAMIAANIALTKLMIEEYLGFYS